MPCFDEQDRQDRAANAAALRFATAALCALVRAVGPMGIRDLLDRKAIDFKEAGITEEQFRTWIAEHRRHDEIRQAQGTTR